MKEEKEKEKEIKVIVVNPPTKEQKKKRLKELCEFLGTNWHIPINKKSGKP